MDSMKKLIVANWKMNPITLPEAIKLARASDRRGVVVASPFVFAEEIGRVLKKAELGAQDVFWKERGAYTGEISPGELKHLKVKYVIIGHSERRALGETDAVIGKKLKTALAHGLKAILCVGEKWNVRKRGIAAAKRFVASQLKKNLQSVVSSKLKVPGLIIAYEPVWAIGTGRNDTFDDVSEMVRFIKEFLVKSYNSRVHVLYGGSVNSKNAKSFLSVPDIDGLLVGGASLRLREFGKIINLRSHV